MHHEREYCQAHRPAGSSALRPAGDVLHRHPPVPCSAPHRARALGRWPIGYAAPVRAALLALACLLPAAARAAGGHDAVGCAGCHSMHLARGEALFALGPNTTVTDPRTGRPIGSLTALCLACHAEREAGGRGASPVSEHFHHPFSVARPDPRLAQVPPELLRGGRFECVGCHDPHPSNPNHRYLRVAVAGAPTLGGYCGLCHPRRSDRAAARPPVFTSMDERAGAGATAADRRAPAAPDRTAPAPRPAP